ncbi:MAG TPA: hypothetical protein VJR03_03500 [Nitrospira sp.]|nr:hypothetical protein [Nitrospira sp.]
MLATRVELGRFVSLIGILALAGCGTTPPSLDMSDGPIYPPGQQVGIVIGSVLVQTDEEPPDSWFYRLFGRKTAGFDYDFEIVRAIDTTNPQPTDNERYKLEVKPAVERIFVARLPFGRYVINGFRYKGLSVLAAELGLNFVVAPRTTLYIGRLIVKVPPRVSLGTPYEVEIENARETTVAALQTQHPGLGRDALDGLIQGR